jgi:hypothetical protein
LESRRTQTAALSPGERVASVASRVRGYLVRLDDRLAAHVTPHPARAGW